MTRLHCLTALFGTAAAFSVQTNCHRHPALSATDVATAYFATREVEAVQSPYDRIGITDEELALGIDPEEFVKYIGTKEFLVDKTLTDIPKLSREQAEEEVSKFLLDQEAIAMYIQFQKMKEDDPDFEVPDNKPDEDGIFSFRTVVILYLAYVAYDTIPNMLRGYVADQQAAGEWKGTNIPFLDDWLTSVPSVSADAVQAVSDTAQAVADVIN